LGTLLPEDTVTVSVLLSVAARQIGDGPSLSQWGLIILLVVLAGIATWVVLKRRRIVTA
jgi:hypothetical protein